ncbi:hypothetical protein [Nocardioides taihuensis]|uniref:DUF4179 domain-containing protein n=1 Tax=Nocardioides taihuensis TaxID=1835606 RepID=A0ABW0BGP6_9ACTN
MSTISDLRETLDRHAEDLVDTGLTGRAGAVRRQVRVARRRRAATAIVAAAVALGGTVTAVGLAEGRSSTPQPASELGGHAVPAQLTSLGYTYAYTDGVAGAESATLSLPATNAPRLVSWAASGDGLELTGPRHDAWSSGATHFDDFAFVAAGDHPTFTASGDDVALAVYELTDAAPEGVTRDGITFRQQVAGQSLLDAAVADSGAARASADIEGAGAGRLTVAYFCTGGGDGTTVHVSVAGMPAASTAGCTDDTFDPGGIDGRRSLSWTPPPGGTGQVRVWATRGPDGPEVVDPDLRLGVGIYGPAESTERTAGVSLPALTERDGHVWQLVDVETSAPGARKLAVTAPGQDVVAQALLTGVPVGTHGQLHSGSRRLSWVLADDEQTGRVPGVLRADDPALRLELVGPAGPDARMAFALYSQLG